METSTIILLIVLTIIFIGIIILIGVWFMKNTKPEAGTDLPVTGVPFRLRIGSRYIAACKVNETYNQIALTDNPNLGTIFNVEYRDSFAYFTTIQDKTMTYALYSQYILLSSTPELSALTLTKQPDDRTFTIQISNGDNVMIGSDNFMNQCLTKTLIYNNVGQADIFTWSAAL